MLRHIAPFADPSVLVDASTADDAGVYLVDGTALVATVDFFTPIVDEPFDFGRIAAANALSDVYAMGARPLFALNLVAFPRDLLGEGILEEIVRGGAEIAREAGIPIIGGHSIDDAEPKYGLAVIGMADPERIVRNSTARPGDALILTKPIGTGVIATAIKRGTASSDEIAAAVTSMATLNRAASEAMLEAGAHAATDVTGFGLLGHLHEMLRGSGASARITPSKVSLLPGALEHLRAGCIAGGTRRNADDAAGYASFADAVPEDLRLLLCDAQTSGGLLIAVPQERAQSLLDRLDTAALIGAVEAGPAGRIQIA